MINLSPNPNHVIHQVRLIWRRISFWCSFGAALPICDLRTIYWIKAFHFKSASLVAIIVFETIAFIVVSAFFSTIINCWHRSQFISVIIFIGQTFSKGLKIWWANIISLPNAGNPWWICSIGCTIALFTIHFTVAYLISPVVFECQTIRFIFTKLLTKIKGINVIKSTNDKAWITMSLIS